MKIKSELSVRCTRWSLAEPFTIARGTKTHADVIEVELRSQGALGRGEAVPYPRYGQSVETEVTVLWKQQELLSQGVSRRDLLGRLGPGPARNALDCALWDLEAKLGGRPVWQLAGLSEPQPQVTALTIPISEPENMAQRAERLPDAGLLKLKLAGDGLDLERVRAVAGAAPRAALWVDANEGLDVEGLVALAEPFAALGVVMIEQPLPADRDEPLAEIHLPIPLCADESFNGGVAAVEALSDRYQLVNVKLDKVGGLTEAIRVCDVLRAKGLDFVLGCMCSSSLSLAPAFMLAADARYVDLDAGYLLAEDREHGLQYVSGKVHPPVSALWG